MIVQLPNGRIIECSLEQYLSLTDEEYQDLNGLSSVYTKEVGDPFYNRFARSTKKEAIDAIEHIEENEPALDELTAFEKLEDPYFHSDDM
jgi:2-oxo-4-hydroxy-4-carboxy--5-ureidoimidazoline (OHCU) decarboxylase